jgi:hypothetical protein
VQKWFNESLSGLIMQRLLILGATGLVGQQLLAKNRPEDWWIDVDEYLTESSSRSGAIAQSSKTYTQEQQECIEKFHSSAQLKIAAFAGTGKTHTLIGIANSAPKQRGLYLAFNKEISNEATRKFSPNMDCLTTHALAYQFCLAADSGWRGGDCAGAGFLYRRC